MNFYKSMLAGCAVMAAGFTATAQDVNTLVIDDFQITPGHKAYATVSVDFSEQIAGLQFDMELPDGISVTKNVIKNTELMPESDNVIVTPSETSNIVRVLVVSPKSEYLKENKGTLMQIEFEAAIDAFNYFPELAMPVDGKVFTDAGNGSSWSDLKSITNIQMGIEKLYMTVPEETQVINPGGEATVTVGIVTSVEPAGMQTYITLPEGFSIKNNTVTLLGDAADSEYSLEDNGNGQYTLLIYRYDGKNAVPFLQGDVFSFDVVAPETIEAENLDVVFDHFEISSGWGQTTLSYSGEEATVKLIDGSIAYANANEALTVLEAQLTAALELIAAECPDVADQFAGEELAAKIADLRKTVDSAYEEKTLTADYDNIVTAAVEALSGEIDAYVEAAKEAQGTLNETNRVEANEAAYNENLAEIAELQAALDEAVADIKANYPDFDVETAAAEIQAIIDDQKAQADAALEAVANEGTYENAVDSAAVLEAIEAMRQSAIDTGITSITVEELGNARIYTTTGVQVSEPVKGAINIVVTEDGKVFKLHIK